MSDFMEGISNSLNNVTQSIADIYKTKYITENVVPTSTVAYQNTIQATIPLLLVVGLFLLLFYKRIRI